VRSADPLNRQKNARAMTRESTNHWLARALRRVAGAGAEERRMLWWSFWYFFCLLSGYYVLRPLRDEMGIAGGVQNLQWVFTGTFLAMLAAVPLFGALAARFPRRRFLPWVYYFFIANILIFFALFQIGAAREIVARAFFIWTSVFNLFVVSVFWSFMADLYSNAQARRLFGLIAAGGSAGAIAGPAATALLAAPLGPVNLLLLSSALLGGAVMCIHRLIALARSGTAPAQSDAERRPPETERPMGGGVFSGIALVFRSSYLLGICLFIWLYTTLSTFIYFEQAYIVRAAFDEPAQRTALFASIDLAVNVITLLLQTLVAGQMMRRAGVTATLALIPILVAAGFVGLGLAPLLPVLIAFQVLRRAGDYGITRPAREVLFTVVGRETKYKAKNFIDTVVYRAGDAVSGWAFAGLKALGVGLTGIAFIAVPVALGWFATAWFLGRKQEELRATGPG
jgi:AAA family ATP:ADP antiporter